MRASWLLSVAICLAACASGAGSRHERVLSLRGPVASASPSRAPAGRSAALLQAHNARRARHCAAALRWSNELARSARRWADRLSQRGCNLQHSDTRFGENLAAGTRGAFSAEAIVQMWYREVEKYSFRRGGFSMKTGHFTQLAWRDTRMVGCGVGQCDDLEVWVCNYDPPGNVEGMFDEQVLPSSCKR